MIKLDIEQFRADCDPDNYNDLLGGGILLGCGGYTSGEIRLYIYMTDKWPNVMEIGPSGSSFRFGHFIPKNDSDPEEDRDYTATIYIPREWEWWGGRFHEARYQDRQGHRIELIVKLG